MSRIRLSKKDVIWSYIAQFLNMGAGLVVLPIILHKLGEQEIAMNYIMLTISSLIALLDFGFLPQFSRNITYVFSGVKDLQKEGVAETNEEINYKLVANMIGVARKVYLFLGIAALALMLTAGSWYMYYATNHYTNIPNSLLIWVLFSISTSLNIYYSYYTSLLTGRGYVKEAKKALIIQKIVYIALACTLLFCGLSLLGVVVANIVSPIIGRYLAHSYFYSEDLIAHLHQHKIRNEETSRLFRIIWYNSKKMGLIAIASFGITKIGMFLGGLYLSATDVASYGLMIQLTTVLVQVSGTHFVSVQPLLGSLFANQETELLKKEIGLGLFFFYGLFFIGLILLITVGPWFLDIIRSNAQLPSSLIVFMYGVTCFLETNTSFFATLIVLGNKINFVTSSILTSLGIVILSFLSLKYTALGIIGLVMAQFLPGTVYSYWKWPWVVCRDLRTSIIRLIKVGGRYSLMKIGYSL